MSTRLFDFRKEARKRSLRAGFDSASEAAKKLTISRPRWDDILTGRSPASSEEIEAIASTLNWPEIRAPLYAAAQAPGRRGARKPKVKQPPASLLRLPPGVPGDYRADVVSLGGIQLTIIGKAPAGVPLEKEEDREPITLLVEDPSRLKDCFGLWVDGDSMIGERLFDGDLAIFRPQEDANDRDVVAAVHEDRVCIKRLRRQRGKVWLESANEAFPLIAVSADERFRVIGVLELSQTNHRRKVVPFPSAKRR